MSGEADDASTYLTGRADGFEVRMFVSYVTAVMPWD
jgi:hypothetical protein